MKFQSLVGRVELSEMRLLSVYAGLATVAMGQSPVVPVLRAPIADAVIPELTDRRVIDLAEVFGVEEVRDEAVRLTATFARDGGMVSRDFDFLLFKNATPITTENFRGYVNRGDYANMMVHRLVRNFVIQGGGFTYDGQDADGNPTFGTIATQPTIMNEFSISNTLGTISMAKLGGNPNSATSQWFISIGNNSDNLDNQNGGFTVFGRISKDTLPNALATSDPAEFRPADLSPFFNSVLGAAPVEASTDLTMVTGDDLYVFESVTEVALPSGQAGADRTLTYTIASQTGDANVMATIEGANLNLDFTELEPGQSEDFVVEARDSVGNVVASDFTLTFQEVYAGWRSREFSAEEAGDDRISGPLADSNGDGVSNLLAFAQGFAPGDLLPNPKSAALILPTTSRTFLGFPIRGNVAGLEYALEQSFDLEDDSWTVVEAVQDFIVFGGEDILRFTRNQDLAMTPKVYYRLKVTLL